MLGVFQKYNEALSIFDLQSAPAKSVLQNGNSSFCFACMYILLGLVYILNGGQPSSTGSENMLNFIFVSMKVFGLLILRHQIQSGKSVQGVSGMTMLTYAACYSIRVWLNMPDSCSFSFMELELEATFGIFSLLLVLDCVKSIFITHRASYQKDLDVLHVKYLIPGCFILAAILRVDFHSWDTFFGYMWSSCLYMDVLALVPQVLMMARGGGKVKAPIVYFVAASFLSQIEELSDSLFSKADMFLSDDCFSYCLIIFFQVVHLLVIVGFIYYYLKGRGAGL